MKRESNPVNEIVVLSNPHRRKRHRTHVRRRRNPSGGLGSIFSGIGPMLKSGAVGAAGALANDIAFGFVKPYLPAVLTSSYGRVGAKLGLAAAVAWTLNKVMPGKGRDFAAGAATVVLHELGTSLLNQAAPSLPLGAYEDNLLGFDSAPSVGAYMGTGAYMPAGQKMGDLLPQ